MTDPNAMTCHFCGVVKPMRVKSGDRQWWNLQNYRETFTGLACTDCYDKFINMQDFEVEALRTAEQVAKELSQ